MVLALLVGGTILRPRTRVRPPLNGIRQKIQSMDDSTRIQIHFYEPNEATVSLESHITKEIRKQWQEMLFFSCFSARQLIAMGNDTHIASSLAIVLAGMLLPVAPLDVDVKAFIHAVLTKLGNAVKLVDSRSGPGRIVFKAELILSPPPEKFDLGAERFDLFVGNVNQYAANSVLLLFQYLSRRKIEDRDYLYNLARVAELCGSTYLNGKLTTENHMEQASTIVKLAHSEIEAAKL